jgi:hypothetical protein
MKKVLFSIIFCFTFGLFFFNSAGLANAQSCSGTMTCCQRYEWVYVPENCSNTCTPEQIYNRTCTPCEDLEQRCADSASAVCDWLAGGGAYGSCYAPQCDMGVEEDNCSLNTGGGGGGGGTASPSPSPSTAPACGDGSCAVTENPTSCPQDCTGAGSCGDGLCPDGGGDNCSNCPQDCGGACVASECGNNVCSNGEDCNGCPEDCGSCSGNNCGNGTCGSGENCSTCPNDCGACTGNFCGNGTCAGLSESCGTCEADCGVCPVYFSWFQAFGGNVFAGLSDSSNVAIRSRIPTACVAPGCTPALVAFSDAADNQSDGFPVTGGGQIQARGLETERTPSVYVMGSAITRVRENFDYFASRYSVGLNPADDFAGNATNATKPTYDANKKYYYHNGNLIIQQAWQVTSGESYVIFVDGDLTLTDPTSVGQLIETNEGGFLAFIVSGNIIIDDNVGNTTLTSTTTNIEGVFIADGTITVESAASGDLHFIGAGSFVGWTNVSLERDYENSDNDLYPTETFIFRPDFIRYTPEDMKRSQVIWQETN